MSSFSLPSRRLTVVSVASPFAASRLLESGADGSLSCSDKAVAPAGGVIVLLLAD